MENKLMFPFLSNNLNPTLIIIFVCIGVLLIVGIVLAILLLRRNKNKKTFINNESEWIDALGGQENIKEATAVGSRLSIVLLNKENINRDRLKELGVSNILVMSNKITLVIENKAEQVCKLINHSLNKE